ncbi:ephrin type-B receptor [Perilla frutescens var. hirtella]|nr:ephrin type-B receptor [Perilla frutescens var. hirtella]KAH6816798.1 ephrin type-B receptor [Perilla frutescens var. frutescens]
MGCSIAINITGELTLKSNVENVAGSVYIVADNANLLGGSVINVTARTGDPLQLATGTPDDAPGGGGGHGGRGASCVMDNKKLPEKIWGGDAYAWESLDKPQALEEE